MEKLPEKVLITNGQLITPYRIIPNGSVLYSRISGKILEVAEGPLDVPDALIVDAEGRNVSPGFIDLHVHGGGGHDFMDGTKEAFLGVAQLHARHGTTAMMPTTLTSETNELFETLRLYDELDKKPTGGSAFIGMHLEGPYFAMKQRGAQDPRYIRNPNPDEYKKILESSSSIRRWSAAPELKGALEFGRYLRQRGILVSMGHTDAIFEEALKGYESGYTLATHFYSMMSSVTRKNCFRYAGVVEFAYLMDEMDVEIICDGVHLPAPLLQLILKVKGPDRVALITDAMRGAGMPPGESILGSLHNGLKVLIEDGVAKLPDRSSFAGSVATADRLVRTILEMGKASLVDAIKMITATPARIAGLASQKGALLKGMDADIVVFDDAINIHTTIVGGKIIFVNESNMVTKNNLK